MRKLYLAAVAAALAIGAFAAFAIAGEGQGNTSLEFKFTKTGKNKPTGSNTILEPAKQDTKGTDDTSDDHYSAPSKSVIKFQAGSNVKTAVKPRCKETPSDVQANRASCPDKTKIGSGVANSIAGQPDEGGGTPIVAVISAFNLKNGIMFVIDPCSPGPPATGPGTGNPCVKVPAARIVLVGDWSKVNTRPTLTVVTPPSLLQGGIIITRFQLKTKKISNDKGAYVTTPDLCRNGEWKTLAVETYTDGSKQTIKDTQSC